jgi:hypothetical protein
VTVVDAACSCARDEEWVAAQVGDEWRGDTELFLQFARDGVAGVFVRFDVAARGKPALRVDVIDEEHCTGLDVDGSEVRDEMLGRNIGFAQAVDLRVTAYPRERLGPVGLFLRIERRDARNEVFDLRLIHYEFLFVLLIFSSILEHMFATLELLAKRRRELDAHEAAWLRELAEFDRSGDWAVDNFQNAASAIRHTCRMTHGVAHANVALARKLEQLPAVAEAFAAGDISARHADVIARAFTPKRAEAMEPFEEALVDAACNAAPDELGRAVRYVTDALDGDGGAASDEELHERRGYHMSRGLDRMLNVDGVFDPESAEIHERAIEAEMARDLRPGETRTYAQRRADAFTNLLRQSLDHGLIGTSRAVRPHITQVVHLDEHPGVTPDLVSIMRAARRNVGRLSRNTLERIMCDCDLTRVLMIGESEILDVGRATRTVTAAQWKALVVRDQHCQHPGCDQPPSRCEAHHTKYWEHGGRTDLENLKLMCFHHHDEEHKSNTRARDARTRDP